MMYGYPNSGTPIGLVGPAHIPYGRKAGLQRHVVQNLTDVNLPGPVEQLTIRAKHEPGISLPPPVTDIEYTETHPVYHAGELSHPRWAAGQQPFPVPQP